MERLPFGEPSEDPIFLHRQADAWATLYPGKPNPYGETPYKLSLAEAIAFRDIVSRLHAETGMLAGGVAGQRPVYQKKVIRRKIKTNEWRGGNPKCS